MRAGFLRKAIPALCRTCTKRTRRKERCTRPGDVPCTAHLPTRTSLLLPFAHGKTRNNGGAERNLLVHGVQAADPGTERRNLPEVPEPVRPWSVGIRAGSAAGQ